MQVMTVTYNIIGLFPTIILSFFHEKYNSMNETKLNLHTAIY